MKEIRVRVRPDGDVEFIDTPELAPLLTGAAFTRRRASHVEPDRRWLRALFHGLRRVFGEGGRVGAWTRSWRCRWRVDLTPSGGPVLPEKYTRREAAITAEVAWLEANDLGRKGAATAPPPDETPEEDYERCPDAADGRHVVDPGTLAAADGYDVTAEGGVVFDMHCKLCGRSCSGRISLNDLMW